MGQKVHPTSFRLGAIKDWSSRWYSTKFDFPDKLLQDLKIRKLVGKELSVALVSHIDIERASNRVRVIIYSGRPGMIIGRKGAQIERLKEQLQNIIGDQNKLFIDIKEISTPALDAKIVADNIAFQLERRIPFRRAMKKAIQACKEAGGEGIKIRCAGRLAGAEIARAESYKWGKIPLQTIRADIDYGFGEARTTYGIIGVKVWIYKGEKFSRDILSAVKEVKKEKEE
ncbi:MAG: 30S ribosomal protein S3 [Candidatus Omnitrophica bacterium]|nr:30S ribosomal protein S3 [Candidatus Omnitrophota bacterium]